jgi:hypothetical protein
LDYRAAILAPVPSDAAVRSCHFFEFVSFAPGSLETFGAKAIAQLIAAKGQMAISASQGHLPSRQKLKSTMDAGNHIEPSSNPRR